MKLQCRATYCKYVLLRASLRHETASHFPNNDTYLWLILDCCNIGALSAYGCGARPRTISTSYSAPSPAPKSHPIFLSILRTYNCLWLVLDCCNICELCRFVIANDMTCPSKLEERSGKQSDTPPETRMSLRGVIRQSNLT